MRKSLLLSAILLSAGSTASAQCVLANFEDVPVGTRWQLNNNGGTTTATVEEEPGNPSNHILHVRLKDWGTFPVFQVPAELAGAAILKDYNSIRFRFYRTANDAADSYKQMHVYYGSDNVYQDNSYPYQGDLQVWQNRSYALRNITEESTATSFSLGIHHANTDYYLDDIALYGPFDDFKEVESGLLNTCQNNTSSSYTVWEGSYLIPEGKSLEVRTSRYSYVTAEVAGTGTLNLMCGGERSFLAHTGNKTMPSWNYFSGDVHIYPYKGVVSSAGFYGMVFWSKTCAPENLMACVEEGKVHSALARSRVTLHNGSTIAFESGTFAARFGELNTEAGSTIEGYYKSKDVSSSLMVGNLGTNGTLAGKFITNGLSKVGLFKEGKGTYRITSDGNQLAGGLRVNEGRMIINGTTSATAYVYEGGTLGGTSTLTGAADCYGTIEPGDTNAGTLTVVGNVTLHPNAKVRIRLKDIGTHTALKVSGTLKRSAISQDFSTSEESPILRLMLDTNEEMNPGEEVVVLTAKSKDQADAWKWQMKFPSKYTWEAEERTLEDGLYALVVRLVSLDDDPANANNDKEDEDQNDGEEEQDTTTYGEDGDTHTLRYYADAHQMRIGMAVSSYTDVNNAGDARVQLIKKHFNMVEPENCLKFESVEPAQNYFDYGASDALAAFAQANGMYMRGHTLAWHSQVAQWVSVDGKKNDKNWTKPQLMAILKNHIFNVVRHFKGKIGEWDVVNECLDDDQSIVRTNPDSYKLRQSSIWTTVCGESFIDSAFVWAHQADPDCKLYLNDYDNEIMGTAKAQAFYNLVKRLQKSGIPIDGVGMQCHFDAGNVDVKALGRNIARFEELGLECTITELDLGIDNKTTNELQQQARDYHNIVAEAMAHNNCRSLLIWGISDDMSWRQSSPLIWNGDLSPKPAFYGVRAALRESATGIDEVRETPAIETNCSTSQSRVIDLLGRPASLRASGLLIVDGRKVMIK